MRKLCFPVLRAVYSESFMLEVLDCRENLLIIAPMKTGSTWLTALMHELTLRDSHCAAPAFCQREQEIDLRSLYVAGMDEKVLFEHQHMRYSEWTEKVILKSGLRCVLLIRNLFDSIVSLYDHCEKLSLRMPLFYMDAANWDALDKNERLNCVIDLAVPWYFNFYAGWLANLERFGSQVSITRYEDLLENPEQEIDRICAIHGLKQVTTPRDAVQAVKGKQTLKNKGISGRGVHLPEHIVNRIERYASYYPAIDFSLIGVKRGA